MNAWTIYNWRPSGKNHPSSLKFMDVAPFWISPIIWSHLTFGRFNLSQERNIRDTQQKKTTQI